MCVSHFCLKKNLERTLTEGSWWYLQGMQKKKCVCVCECGRRCFIASVFSRLLFEAFVQSEAKGELGTQTVVERASQLFSPSLVY